jgi:valyl-tRNA synthetase
LRQQAALCVTAGAALIVAAWPKAGAAVDPIALAHFSALQSMVKAIRAARQEYGVEPARRVRAVLRVEDEGLREALTAELKVRVQV